MAQRSRGGKGDSDVNENLLKSFSLINVELSNKPEVMAAIERRVGEIENCRTIDFISAVNNPRHDGLVRQSMARATKAVLRDMGLKLT